MVHRYHDGTKHHFQGYARSLGYLDWASQPRPFRGFAGAKTVALYPSPDARPAAFPPVSYDRLFAGTVPPTPITAAAIGDVLRHSLGLSAWKSFRGSRWSLRVNPSSGNLHPTEAYVVAGGLPDLDPSPGVWHYAPDRHLLEHRCRMADEAWPAAGLNGPDETFLVALTSIHWREAWKYGERAFRYCQHDLGHAVAAVSIAAAMHGWRVEMVPGWSLQEIGALIGTDRDQDYVEVEREEPGCLLRVSTGQELPADAGKSLISAAVSGAWSGQASQLSEDHVQWTFIDEVAEATRPPLRATKPDVVTFPGRASDAVDRGLDARAIVLGRRSAVAFNGSSAIDRAGFSRLIESVRPDVLLPSPTQWWAPRIHLLLFVHRVTGLEPGLYMLVRDPARLETLRTAIRQPFLWEPVEDGLWLLQRGDFRIRSKHLSCDQDIASDGFFSLGMLAEFDAALEAHGPGFYRNLFWESGIVGQRLYLEAEAAGARATGIGCFFDDGVHEVLGLEGHAFQSLYHFTVGVQVDDGRLTTEPGYAWESRQA